VPSFVVDSTILLPGVGDPATPERKLLILAAYGRLTHYARFGRDELTNPAAPAGELGGRPIEVLLRQADEGAAILGERLPYGSREDFQLVTSLPILDQFEAILRRSGVGRGLGMSAELARRARWTVLHLAANILPFPRSEVKPYLGSLYVDLLIETAVRGRAEFVFSDAPEVAPFVGQSVTYEGGEIRILDFASFLAEVLGSDYDLEAIDGRLLEFAGPLLQGGS
jgi:hypothetical protein